MNYSQTKRSQKVKNQISTKWHSLVSKFSQWIYNVWVKGKFLTLKNIKHYTKCTHIIAIINTTKVALKKQYHKQKLLKGKNTMQTKV